MESDDIRSTDLLDGVSLRVLTGDARELLKTLPDESVNCCVTSPPYWGLRDYGHAGQLGLERTPQEYVERMTEIFREVRRVLRGDGTLWLNLADSYNSQGGHSTPESDGRANRVERQKMKGANVAGLKTKDMIAVPWRTALALQSDGWYLRSDIIWAKPNPMPESVTDRPTKSHEYIFLLTKSERYYYDADSIRESANGIDATRNKRTVWTITPQPYREAHFATFPPDLVRPCVMAGCPVGGIVLDPFAGSGTTGMVALELGRRTVLCELNPEYVKLINKRTNITEGFRLPSNAPHEPRGESRP